MFVPAAPKIYLQYGVFDGLRRGRPFG